MIAAHYEIDILPEYVEPEVLLMQLAGSLTTTIFLGGNGDHVVLGLAGTEVSYEEVASQTLQPTSVPEDVNAGFFSGIGYMGLLSYDHFDSNATAPCFPCRVFDVTESMVWNRNTRQMARHRSRRRSGQPWTIKGTHDLTPTEMGTHDAIWGTHDVTLSYGHLVSEAIRDIRDGRYYQINLLKYFAAPEADFLGLAARISRWGGSMSSAWRIRGLEVVSLSPERFVRISPSRHGLSIETRPIKGTIKRGHTSESDTANADSLMTSPKERAELAMIIDLMRNDLNRVCESGSVQVVSSGHIESLPYAHHRVGVVRGKLGPQSFGELVNKLLPGGSITGAPKLAAMQAIRSYEGRNRGYFMGAAFFWDPTSGYLDSSLLIRTAYRERCNNESWEPFSFAAGSGIVLDSDPAAEECEVMLKAQCMTST